MSLAKFILALKIALSQFVIPDGSNCSPYELVFFMIML